MLVRAAAAVLFQKVLPAGDPATGRRTRGKRLVFRILCVQQQRVNALIYNDTGCFCCKSDRAAEVKNGAEQDAG